MKRLLFVIGLMFFAGQVLAQQFQNRFEVVLPDSIQSTHSEWVDLDNDGLLDVLLVSRMLSGKVYFQFVKGDTLNAPVLHQKKKLVLSNSSTVLVDYDRDNKMDVILSGEKNGLPLTAVYINQGNFEFIEKTVNVPSFTTATFADVDNDARPEWILSGEENGISYLKLLKQESTYSWKVVHDTLKIKAHVLEVLEATGDGQLDIFVSGEIKPDSLVSGWLINQGGLYFKPGFTDQLSGVASTGDVNLDGFFDVMLMGQDKSSSLKTALFESAGGLYALKNDAIVLKDPNPFVADFNSDGTADVNYYGKTTSNDTLNFLRYGSQDYDTLSHALLVSQTFGDLEHDGDLDLLQISKGNAIRLIYYLNKPANKNRGPVAPIKGVAVGIFNRRFVYWDRSADDHTATAAITYDLHLDGSPEYQAGDYDLLNEKRLVVSHGNNGTQNFRLLRKVNTGSLNFSVQAVDNSFHAGGLCIGGGGGSGGGGTCVNNVETEALSACTKEEIVLAASEEVLWFSFSKGFLGIASELVFPAVRPDTLFYFNPGKSGCYTLKAWTLEIKNDTLKTEKGEQYSCQDAELQLSVEAGWSNIHWTSQVKGDLGTSSAIMYKVQQPDSIFVTLSNGFGCTLNRRTAVKISKPTLVLAGDNYKIMKGSEVQLSVSGAQRYEWTPANGLSKTDIGNPVASPSSSVQYQVTGYDSLGCTDKASVSVFVEGAGFIPNLFTPNDDGKNDELKIYGLADVKDFTFSIYNREGSTVYKTSDVTEAVQRGWDGTKGGAKQPSGVYFWKVKGEVTSGDRILLNGKDSGSIVLVR